MELTKLQNVLTHYILQGEISTFTKICLSAFLSLSYCYFSAKHLTRSTARLAAFLPVISLFLALPLYLKSVHLTAITSFFLAWLANFKLIMLAFDKGPLPYITSLPTFIALACLPIKLQSRKSHDPNPNKFGSFGSTFVNYSVKIGMFSALLKIYDYENSINQPVLIMSVYIFHIYLSLELILAFAQAAARGLIGAELEPQFNEPYLSSSLQDFWGRRWNLMVTRILRPTVYIPVLEFSTRIMGREWASLPAVMSTFVVSGLIHELIIFYICCQMRPTWEMTWFFILHGACLVVEIAAKKAVGGRWRVPRVVATVLTVAFVMATGLWLFLPPFLRCGAKGRGLAEVAAVVAFVKDLVKALLV